MCVHVFGLLCGSGLAGADSPYGFVGENELAEIFGAEAEESLFNLLFNYIVVCAVFAFFENFADAEDGGKAVGECEFNLFGEDFRGFAVVLTAFAVAENYIFCAGAGYHGSRNFAGVCAFFVVCAVFCTKAQTVLVDNGIYACQVSEGNTDYYIAFGLCAGQSGVYFFGKGDTFLEGGVHFPVAGNYILSHFLFVCWSCLFFRLQNYKKVGKVPNIWQRVFTLYASCG